MAKVGNDVGAKEKNPIEAFMYQFTPYWPLFLILVLLAGGGAYAYLKLVAKPVYEITANILVEDGKKGADESKLMEALNISSNKTVDNEIEVIQSKELLKEVIDSLYLYASIQEERMLNSRSAYNSSPVLLQFKNPKKIPDLDVDPIYFSFNNARQTISVQDKTYSLNEWFKTPYGVAKFIKNPHFKTPAEGQLFFNVYSTRAVLNNLSMRLLVTPASKLSSVIVLKFTDEVPERGEDIINALMRAYYRSAVNDKNMLAQNMLSFVEGRIDNVSAELDSIENHLQRFRNQNGVINLSEQGRLYLQNVGDNDRKMTDLNMQLAMLDQVEKYVTSKDNSIGIVPSISGVQDQKLLNQLLQKLYESQIQYEKLKKTIPEGNPTMYSLKNEINNIRPTILENIRNQKESLLAGKSTLTSETGKYRSMLSSIPQNEKQLLDISRQQAIKNDAYSFLLQKREETQLAYAAMVTNSKTINYANASFDPVSPKKLFVIAASLALALLLGFGFVYAKESFTNKILFRADIENITDIPIIAEIMSVKGKDPIIIKDHNRKQLSFVEQFHHLRFAMGLNNKFLKYKKILVTSGNAGEGKSFISNNLARSLALSGKRVVIVDFDFRNPKTSALYQMTVFNGLAEFFENDSLSISEIVYPTNYDDLFVIPAGYATLNPTELLFKKDLDKLFYYLENNFDYIILDTAPVDPIIDAYMVSEFCDAILFVIRHGYTRKAMLESLHKNNKINSLKNIFIVFNDIKSRGFMNKGYGFGYGYGSNKMYGDKVYQTRKLTNEV